MNKYQKELLQHALNDEKQVLNDLRKTYEQAEKDIDKKIEELMGRIQATEDENLMQSAIYQRDMQLALKKQISGILDDLNGNEFNTISEYISKCYENGFIGALYDMQGQGVPLIFPIDQEQATTAVVRNSKLSKSLYTSLGEDVAELKKRVQSELSRGIAQNYSYSQIARLIKNQTKIGYNKAVRIARTEGHRVQQAAQADAQVKAKDAGADVVKQWDATLDGRTRPSHRQLDGQIKELDEPFEINGYKAQYPGDFGTPSMDVNCRCSTLTRARWALDESDATKWDNETGQLVEIESKNYEEFKKNYFEIVYNSGKTQYNRIINSDEVYDHAITESISKLTSFKEIQEYFADTDGRSPISESISQLSLDTQKEIAEGIEYVRQNLNLTRLPYLYEAKDLPFNIWGKLSIDEDGRRIVIFNKKLLSKNIKEAFPTAVHETVHFLDVINRDYSDKIVKAAIKNLKLTGTSKERTLTEIIGVKNYRYLKNNVEIFAYAMEKEAVNKGNKLSKEILRLTQEEQSK